MGADIGNNLRIRPTVRVLFGSFGWPCGLWDVASYAKKFAGADVRIVPLRCDSLFDCEINDFRAIPRYLSLHRGFDDASRNASISSSDAFGLILDHLGIEFARELMAQRPHVVGFRLEAGRLDDVRNAIQAVKFLSDAEIVVGGPSVTSHPEETLAESGADYAFYGEAEEAFALFLRSAATKYNSKDLQPDVPGLVYRWAGRVVANRAPTDGYGRNPSPPFTSEATAASNPIDPTAFGRGWDREPFDSLFLVGGRGCPGRCSFCAKTHGAKVRVKNATQLMDEAATLDDLVRRGVLRVTRWPLFAETDRSDDRTREVAWLAVFDEDFFLNRTRALDFFTLWEQSPLRKRYRLNFQTNPCSLLDDEGRADAELFARIDRLKPMIQLGVESFHPELLKRWRKRHDLVQLETVLHALEETRQDYSAFQLLTDYATSPSELLDNLWLLTRAARRFPRMRIAVNPFMIPLGGSDVKSLLEFASDADGSLDSCPYSAFETAHPEWMNPLTAALADLADEHLQGALFTQTRDAAFQNLWDALANYFQSPTRKDAYEERNDVQEEIKELATKTEWFRSSFRTKV